MTACANMPQENVVIDGGFLTMPWMPDIKYLDGEMFTPVSTSNSGLARFLAGRVSMPGNKDRVLSKLGILERLRLARNFTLQSHANQLSEELEAMGEEAVGGSIATRGRKKDVRKALEHRPEWHMLSEAYQIEARLAHSSTAPLRCKVLKGRANDPVWIQLTADILDALRTEMDFVLHRASEDVADMTPPRRKRSREALGSASASSSAHTASSPPSSSTPPQQKHCGPAVTFLKGRRVFLARVWMNGRIHYHSTPVKEAFGLELQRAQKDLALKVAWEWARAHHQKKPRAKKYMGRPWAPMKKPRQQPSRRRRVLRRASSSASAAGELRSPSLHTPRRRSFSAPATPDPDEAFRG